MLYVKIDESGNPVGAPVNERDLRKVFKDVSLPDVLYDEVAAHLGYACVPPTKVTIERLPLHALRLTGAVRNPDGALERVYTNVPYTEAEIAARFKELRDKRDRLLRESDFTQLSDIPEATRTAWASYRQQLRDLPVSVVDPVSAVFPTPPTV